MENKMVIYSDGNVTHLFVDGKYIQNVLSIIYEHSTNRDIKISIPHVEIGLSSIPAIETEAPEKVMRAIREICGMEEKSPSK